MSPGWLRASAAADSIMNRREPDAFASLFGETGSAVGFDGSQMNGQTERAATLRGIFAHHQTAAYVAKLREIRTLGSNAVQSLLVVREAGRPRIALLHNTPAAFHGRPHMVDELTGELAEVARRGQLVAGPG